MHKTEQSKGTKSCHLPVLGGSIKAHVINPEQKSPISNKVKEAS